MQDKEGLRREVLARRDALARAEREEKSARIAGRVLSLPEYASAGTIFIYADFRSEVATRALMKQAIADGRRVVASRTIVPERRLLLTEISDPDHELRPGYMGIPEPAEGGGEVPPSEIDLVLTPAVGYDETGNRLGYGGGYYDRLFGMLRPDAYRVGLAFEAQIVPAVPVEPHDIPIPVIVTEKRVIRRGATAQDGAGDRFP